MRFLKVILVVMIAGVTPVLAQQRGQQALMRIHAAKIAYITDRLRLSQEQAGNFIPQYNDDDKEVRNTRLSYLGKYQGPHSNDTDDAASRKYIDDNLDYQQAIIDLKRRYNDRFVKIISAQQLADLYNAEREFRQMLMKRLNQNRQGPPPGRFGR